MNSFNLPNTSSTEFLLLQGWRPLTHQNCNFESCSDNNATMSKEPHEGLKKKLDKLTKKIFCLKNELRISEKNVANLNKKNEELQGQVSRLSKDLRMEKGKVRDLQELLNRKTCDDCKKWQTENTRFKVDNAKLRREKAELNLVHCKENEIK